MSPGEEGIQPPVPCLPCLPCLPVLEVEHLPSFSWARGAWPGGHGAGGRPSGCRGTPQAPEQGQEGLKAAWKELTLRDSWSPGASRSQVRRRWARA